MGVLDDIRREIEQAVAEAKRAAQEAQGPRPQPQTVPRPTAPPTGGGRLERQSLERSSPTQGGTGLTREGNAAPALSEFDLDLPPAPTARPGRLPAPVAPEPDAAAPAFTVTPHDIVRAILLGEVIDEPKGRRAGRPHPK